MHHKPNPPELVLLKALWKHGAMPVRPLHDICEKSLEWSFSSTRKTMQRMTEKGFVTSEKPEAKGAILYTAKVSKTQTLAYMAQDFMHRVLEMEGPLPAATFTDSKILTEAEIDELTSMLEDKPS
ncbi:MAG: penicillinase repressor [Robiginitomaculum sp.]|nr:MAG: penicillinase repressor [Robiginitomaculum sp.]